MGSDFLNGLGETITKTAKELGEKAESFYGVQKLRSKIASEKNLQEKALVELGKQVYSRYQAGEELDEILQALCRSIQKHDKAIEKYQDELSKTKGEKLCPDCGKAVAREAAYCPYCGAPCGDLPTEPAEEAEAVWETVDDSCTEEEPAETDEETAETEADPEEKEETEEVEADSAEETAE